MFVKKLDVNVSVPTDFGNVTLTHEGMEYIVSSLNGGFIKATLFQGVMVPGIVTEAEPTPDKVFKRFEETRMEKNFTIAELKPLRDAKAGKAKDDFRLSDIYNYAFKGIAP